MLEVRRLPRYLFAAGIALASKPAPALPQRPHRAAPAPAGTSLAGAIPPRARRAAAYIRMSVSLSGGLRYHRSIAYPERASDHCALLWLPRSRRTLLDVGYNIASLGAAFRGLPAADFVHLTVAPFDPHQIGTIASRTAQVTILARRHLFVGTASNVSVRYGGLIGVVTAGQLFPLYPGGRPVTMQARWSCTTMMKIDAPRG